MSNSQTKKLTVAMLALLILSLCLMLGFSITKNFPNYRDEVTLVKEEIFDDISIIGLHIDSLMPDVKIIDNLESDTIIIRQYSRKNLKDSELFKTSVNNKTLKIDGKSRNWISFDLSFLFQDNRDELIEIYVPKDRIETLNINQGSGSLAFTDFKLKTADIHLSSGEIQGNSLTAENLTLTTSSGDLDIQTLEGNGIIKISSGQNNFNSILGDLNITVSSGNLNSASFTGTAVIKISSGGINIDKAKFTDSSSMRASSGSINLGVDSNDLYCYNASKSSGSINTPQSSCGMEEAINLDIDISSGSVSINNR